MPDDDIFDNSGTGEPVENPRETMSDKARINNLESELEELRDATKSILELLRKNPPSTLPPPTPQHGSELSTMGELSKIIQTISRSNMELILDGMKLGVELGSLKSQADLSAEDAEDARATLNRLIKEANKKDGGQVPKELIEKALPLLERIVNKYAS